MQRFNDRTVIITGASEGVGLACAELFHAEGANVVLVARRLGPLQEAASGFSSDRVLVHQGDVSEHLQLEGLVRSTIERFGSLNGIVNNAGAHFRGSVEIRTADELSRMVDVNLRAPIALTALCLPYLLKSGGFVVNIASLAGHAPLDGAATYSATKAGLRAFTFALAEELRETGVTVSAVSPGPIATDFILSNLDEVDDIVFSQEMTTASAVASMVCDCAHDGTRERSFPPSGAKLALVSYLFPVLRRWLSPVLRRKGRRVKDALRRGEHRPSTSKD